MIPSMRGGRSEERELGGPKEVSERYTFYDEECVHFRL